MQGIVEQSCPLNKSFLQLVFKLGMMALTTVGLIFFNLWVSMVYLIYSVAFFFLIMPLTICK